jgi:hypothetical protein
LNIRLLLIKSTILISFLLAPIWLKWPFAPPPFTSNYVLGFGISALMLLVILFWAMSGFWGWRNFFHGYWRMVFLVCLILLTGWTVISQEWAFGRNLYAGMAQTAALQMVIVMGFVIVIIAIAPPLRLILIVLIISMLIHGTIGALQVYFQQSLGLAWLGEFTLNTRQAGVSVLEADGLRWLRPYGLSPHPNILAGIIVLGLFAAAAFVVQGKRTILSSIAFLMGFFFLLLTFSRGAWLGFVVAALVALLFLKRETGFWRRILPLFGLTVIVGLIFLWVYQPFFLSRTGFSEENTEQRSISDRLVFMEIAWDAIEKHSMQGVGAGNFPWYASNYLFFRTDYDLKGNNVHNIYLTVWSELGLVGLVLFLGMLVTGTIAVLRKDERERLLLLAGVLAWAIIGFVDHYMWTLILSQSVWLGLLAAAIAEAPESPYNEKNIYKL